MKKQLWALLASCVLALLAAVPLAEATEVFAYTVKADGSCAITGYQEDAETGFQDGEGRLEIPAEIDGHPVTEIGSGAFSGCEGISSLLIPGTVKRIGNGAFSGCMALESVVIEEGVMEIGEEAFFGCAALSRAVLPWSVHAIGERAFAVSLPDSEAAGVIGGLFVTAPAVSFAAGYCLENDISYQAE